MFHLLLGRKFCILGFGSTHPPQHPLGSAESFAHSKCAKKCKEMQSQNSHTTMRYCVYLNWQLSHFHENRWMWAFTYQAWFGSDLCSMHLVCRGLCFVLCKNGQNHGLLRQCCRADSGRNTVLRKSLQPDYLIGNLNSIFCLGYIFKVLCISISPSIRR